MAQCSHCGTSILFGGIKDGSNRYCNADCQEQGKLLAVVNEMPDEFIVSQVEEARQSPCPKCDGPGPVDVHTHHYAVSIIFMTTWNSTPEVCCRTCATWSKLKGCVISFFFGWWGIPFGLIATPIQILRNFVGFFTSPAPGELEKVVHMSLAAKYAEHQRRRNQPLDVLEDDAPDFDEAEERF